MSNLIAQIKERKLIIPEEIKSNKGDNLDNLPCIKII